MDGLDKIPAATAEDLRAFEVACGIESYPVTPWHRVAAHYKRRLAEAERLLRMVADTFDAASDDEDFVYRLDLVSVRKFLEAK